MYLMMWAFVVEMCCHKMVACSITQSYIVSGEPGGVFDSRIDSNDGQNDCFQIKIKNKN